MWTNLSSDEHPTWEERSRLILYEWENYVEVQNTEHIETSALRNLSSFQMGNWCGNVKQNSVKLKKESLESRRHTPAGLTETETFRSHKVDAVRPRCGFCGDDSQSEHPSDWRGVLERVGPEWGCAHCNATVCVHANYTLQTKNAVCDADFLYSLSSYLDRNLLTSFLEWLYHSLRKPQLFHLLLVHASTIVAH